MLNFEQRRTSCVLELFQRPASSAHRTLLAEQMEGATTLLGKSSLKLLPSGKCSVPECRNPSSIKLQVSSIARGSTALLKSPTILRVTFSGILGVPQRSRFPAFISLWATLVISVRAFSGQLLFHAHNPSLQRGVLSPWRLKKAWP